MNIYGDGAYRVMVMTDIMGEKFYDLFLFKTATEGDAFCLGIRTQDDATGGQGECSYGREYSNTSYKGKSTFDNLYQEYRERNL